MTNDKWLVAGAYIFGVPALYILLTEKRKNKFTGRHGTRALLFWVALFVLYIILRFLVNLVWKVVYLPVLDSVATFIILMFWVYLLYLGFRAYRGEMFE